MINFAQVGNDLYTGKRSIDFIGRQKTWYALSAVLIVLALVGIFARGLNFGIEFSGGSEFRIQGVSNSQDYEQKAQAAVGEAGIGGNVVATVVGQDTVRVQTEAASERTDEARTALAEAFGVQEGAVSASLIGPSWGETVSQQAIRGLIVFLVLVTLVMALYFRTWKMAVAGLVALLHDLVITVGIYSLFGFEITPSSMIGFLTILGYSLYDTVVVFDKVRENTAEAFANKRMTYREAANLAVNQTLVRSINTTVVALLPIAAVLFVGFTLLGPGTLLDLSLALFIGIAVGAYSSIFIATPLLVDLRRKDKAVVELDRYVARHGSKGRPAPPRRRRLAPTGLRSRPSSEPTARVRLPTSRATRHTARCTSTPRRARATSPSAPRSPSAEQHRRRHLSRPPGGQVARCRRRRWRDRHGRARREQAARHPRLPAAGDRLQGLHAAARRRGRLRGPRRRHRRALPRSGRRRSSASRPAASSSPRRWPTSSVSAWCRCARPASCRARRSRSPTRSSTARREIEVHTDAFEPGQRVLVLDDVLATGGTAEACAQLVERAGASVAAIEVVLELGFLDGRSRLTGHVVNAILTV